MEQALKKSVKISFYHILGTATGLLLLLKTTKSFA